MSQRIIDGLRNFVCIICLVEFFKQLSDIYNYSQYILINLLQRFYELKVEAAHLLSPTSHERNQIATEGLLIIL